MGSNSSQPSAELSEEDVEFISSKAKIDHESVRVWYEKLKVCFSLIVYSNSFDILRQLVPMGKSQKQIQ
jgi:hypothetical protein